MILWPDPETLHTSTPVGSYPISVLKLASFLVSITSFLVMLFDVALSISALPQMKCSSQLCALVLTNVATR